jgi:hypothetical protein
MFLTKHKEELVTVHLYLQYMNKADVVCKIPDNALGKYLKYAFPLS